MIIDLIFNHRYSPDKGRHLSADRLIFLHWLPYKKERGLGADASLLDDLISHNNKSEIDNKAIKFIRGWFHPFGYDFTRYNNISIGEILEYPLLGGIIELFKMYYAFEELIKQSDLVSIRTDLDPLSSYFAFTQDYFSSRNIQVEAHTPYIRNPFISPTAINNYLDRNGNRSTLKKLKTKYLDFIYRERKPRWDTDNHFPVVFSCYRNEVLILEYLNSLAEESPILPVLDRVAMPPDALSRKFINKGALILNRRKKKPNDEENNFRDKAIEYINSDEYRKFLNSSFGDESLAIAVRRLLTDNIKSEFPSKAADINYYEEQFDKIKASAVVVYNDTVPHQKLLVLLARRMGIPSILIQHGYHAERNDGDKRYADYLAVWGTAVKDIYTDDGRDPDSIKVTGNPYHDSFFEQSEEPIKRERKILIITHPENRLSAFGEKGLPEKYMEEIVKAMGLVSKEMEWVVKLHPSESERYYRDVLEFLIATDVSVVKGGDLLEMLKTCRAVVLPDSTVHTEAYLCKTPMVCLNISGRIFEPPLDGSGAIPVVKDFRETAEIINSICESDVSKIDYKLSDYIKTDGDATAAVTRFIISTAKRYIGHRESITAIIK